MRPSSICSCGPWNGDAVSLRWLALPLVVLVAPWSAAQPAPELSISSGYEYGTIQVGPSSDDKLHYAADDGTNKAIPVEVRTEGSAWTISVSRPREVAERTPAVLSVQVPKAIARIHVLNPRGRLQIANVAADLDVRGGSGRNFLKNVGSVTLVSGSGEVEVEDVRGSVTLDTESANVTVKNVRGDFTFSLGSGNLTAARIAGDVSGKASTGNIDLAEPGGLVRIRSINGNTRVLCPRGAVEIHDSSGVSEVVQPAAGADVETSTGRTSIYASSTQPQLIKAKTLAGAATLVIPEATGLEITLDSFQKNIELDPALSNLSTPSPDGKHVSVTQGTPKLRVFMESFGGRLALHVHPLPPCTGGER